MNKTMAIAALGALAQDTRLEIFRLLVERGPEGMPAGEIGERLKQPSPTLSFHLNQLRHARLVSSRRESRSIIYRANFDTMIGLIAYLTDKCCGGRSKPCGPDLFSSAACAVEACGAAADEPIQTKSGRKAAASAKQRNA